MMPTFFKWFFKNFIRFRPMQTLASTWKRLFVLTLFAVFFYTFMEWLFFVTKPSFMDPMSFWEKLGVFLETSYLIALIVAPLLLGLFLLYSIPFLRKINVIFIFAAALIPASLIAVTFLLWFDNFTYTTFQFGIINSHRYSRLAYFVGFLGVCYFVYRWTVNTLARRKRVRWLEKPAFPGAIVLAGLTLLTLWQINWTDLFATTQAAQASLSTPNIILLGSDGVNAVNMSLYGYERKTTPNIDELAKTSLVAENAFSNAGNTSGSVISMLTGKSVAETRVIYPPDILRGAGAYQHLPGILSRLGYHTVQITFPHYIDAYFFNLQDGFDIVNQESQESNWIGNFLYRMGIEDSAYFLTSLYQRATERLLHIARLRNMTDPYKLVTSTTERRSDLERAEELIDLIRNSEKPFFVHVHMMVTHGPNFNPRQQVFSAGEEQSAPWMTDFYDDAILDFDAYVEEIISVLEETGKFDNTILIIDSDHGQGYITTKRVPLVIHFPNGEYAKRVSSNLQNLDIAPTILDYMGLPVAKWMVGQSLLSEDPVVLRPIFSSGVNNDVVAVENFYFHDPHTSKPPFFQFGWFNVNICQKYATLNVKTMGWVVGEIAGHTAPCSDDELPSVAEMQAILLDHLESNGFDVSSIPPDLPVQYK